MDTLQTENDKAAEDIQFFQNHVKTLSECKVQYKSMKAEKKRVSSHNKTLRKQLNDVQQKCRSEQPLQEKISTVQADNRTLQRENQEQRNQIKTLTEPVTAPRQEGDNLLKDLRELIKGVERRVQEAKRGGCKQQ
ncbi:Lamin-like protein [Dissostichus eleginoides]|uniref:Lamin-like protein n=1 Tax=Dissostichus eleginoides TaxID=100907 RepID=A0AAD9CDW6_DISEL|nr:Lamin-like protein [Dissostichus eleginoides]